MSGRSLITPAILLNIVAGIAIFADEGRRDTIVETKKVVVSEPSRSSTDSTKTKESVIRTARVLFITAQGCEHCEKELSRLNKAGGEFDVMRLRGWKIGEGENNHVQIIDGKEIPDLVALLKVKEYPTVACIENGQIVRSFKEGCTTPLDAWTFGWLLKGQNERPQSAISEVARVETTGNYRLRGNHWTLEGDPNPSKQTIVNHLRGPNHGHASGAYGAIENWSYEELRSLHDDLHEREGGTYGNFAQPQFRGTVAANQSLEAFSGNRKVLGK
jgi:hypothetical protein